MTQILKASDEELVTWKEIAAYLRISVRHAQQLHKYKGLPVRRLPGKRTQVFAFGRELDAWKRESSVTANGKENETVFLGPRPESPSLPGNPVAHQAKRQIPWRTVSFVLAAGILVIAAWGPLYRTAFASGEPFDFFVQGKNLIVVNAGGQELWRHTFVTPIHEPSYQSNLDPSVNKSRYGWLGDLDGDGRKEMLFVLKPTDYYEAGDKVLCFSHEGKVEWEFTPGGVVTNAGGIRMVPPYYTSCLQVVSGKSPGETRIVVSSNHYMYDPDQVAILETGGRILGEYWHPGYLLYMSQADLDKDGKVEVLLAGVNNGNHEATLVVLDPLQVSGRVTPTALEDPSFRLTGMAPAMEKAVVFFPRSCVSKGQPYNRVQALAINQDRVRLSVNEGVAAFHDPSLNYELDFGLDSVSVVIGEGDSYYGLHRDLELKGEIDHVFSEMELSRLKRHVKIVRPPSAASLAQGK